MVGNPKEPPLRIYRTAQEARQAADRARVGWWTRAKRFITGEGHVRAELYWWRRIFAFAIAVRLMRALHGDIGELERTGPHNLAYAFFFVFATFIATLFLISQVWKWFTATDGVSRRVYALLAGLSEHDLKLGMLRMRQAEREANLGYKFDRWRKHRAQDKVRRKEGSETK